MTEREFHERKAKVLAKKLRKKHRREGIRRDKDALRSSPRYAPTIYRIHVGRGGIHE